MASISQAFRCFDEVARSGSIRKAAEALHLTAPAVHQQIVNMEQQVGAPLFDRLPRGMQLTTAGEIMIAAIRRGQRDFDNALTQVDDLRSLRRGQINVAVSQSTAEETIPRVIRKAVGNYPGLAFIVRAGSGEDILKWVVSGDADLGFCLRRHPPPGVEEVRVVEQHLGVVTGPGHPLTQRRGLRLRDCLEYPLLMMLPGTELRALVDRIGWREHRRERPLVETSSVALARDLVSAGIGIAFMLTENVASDVANGRLVWTALEDAGARCQSCIYQRSGHTTTVAMGMLLQFFEDELTLIARQMMPRSGSPA